MKQEQVATSISGQNDKKPLILIVDDSRVVRISLSNILNQKYQLIEATDGEQAWKILQETTEISLIFSDLTMPKLGGRELLRRVRQAENEKIRSLPFIVITAEDGNSKIHSQLKEEGVTELVIKPFDSEIISKYVEAYISSGLVDSTRSEHLPHVSAELDGISNKDIFIQSAKKELSFAIRSKNELALLLLKFDQFDKIKKHYSEPAIEHILVTTAEIIRSYTRIEDLVSYFGEGTFAILCPANNSIGTRHLGRKILSDVHAKKYYLEETEATVTASIGISAPEIKPGITFSDLINIAEQRLYAAINAGGNRVVDKGNATITPINTLLPDSQEMSSNEDTLIKQTELSMRKLVRQEASYLQAERSSNDRKTDNEVELETISDTIYHYESENRLLKEKLLKVQQHVEDIDKIKHQLHETDILQQQTILKHQQLQIEYEEMQHRAESAESSLKKLSETENDRSIIEQHLLQESELLQRKLNVVNEQKEKSFRAYKEIETELANLKLKFKKQKEEFEIELADERVLRNIAEEKLSTLRKQLIIEKKEENPIIFTAAPSFAQTKIDQKGGKPLNPDKLTIENSYTPIPISTNVHNSIKTSSTRYPGKPRKSWPFRLLFLTIFILSSIIGFKIWDGVSSKAANAYQDTKSLTVTKTSPNSADSKTKAEHIDEPQGHQKSNVTKPIAQPSPTSLKIEEAKLQAELDLRRIAEEEFLLLSN